MQKLEEKQDVIEEGNILIAEFEGGWRQEMPYVSGAILTIHFPDNRHEMRVFPIHSLKYHSSFDWLMPVCYKWDNIFEGVSTSLVKLLEHNDYCSKLDHVAISYEILPVFEQLVENIKWYNKNK